MIRIPYEENDVVKEILVDDSETLEGKVNKIYNYADMMRALSTDGRLPPRKYSRDSIKEALIERGCNG